MSDLTDAQTLATYNASGSAPASVIQPSGYNEAVTVTSGVPFQISAKRLASLYVNVSSAATTLAITMGPTAAGTTVALSPAQLTGVGLIHVRVPVGWYVVITGTAANFSAVAILE